LSFKSEKIFSGQQHLIYLIQPVNTVLFYQFLTGLFLALLISILSLKMKFLTRGGSIATFTLAFLIYGFGGWQWTIPILSFFISSSILSNIRERRNPSAGSSFEKPGARDFYQVFANGGLGGMLVVVNYIYPDKIWYLIYAGIIASSCADTWATEIGTMSLHKTYDILKLKTVEQGTSGGVSFVGFAGAMLGAIFISLISALWTVKSGMSYIISFTSAGFAASIIDSVLGASIQVQYRCQQCNRIVDNQIHCGRNALKFRGIKWINNDFVNLAAGVSGGIIVFTINTI
jgi:uncharacterized protein (TIGR00297 family)